jgi:pimeloyl-ACP methyl ester carboxylesterase
VPDARVQAAIDNWAPRFTTNGVDPNDFRTTTARIERWDEWLDAWTQTAETHAALGEEARAAGNALTAGEAFVRAAVCFHFAKFVWVLDAERNRATTQRAIEALYAAHALLDPTAERVEAPLDGGVIAGNLRRPGGVDKAPLVILIPGLDSTKEEFFHWEGVFLDRGMATLSLDGPGQGETGFSLDIRPDYEAAVGAILDAVSARGQGDVDLERVGAVGVSLGGYYAPRAAAFEPRLRAVAGISGPYDFAANWDGLPSLTRETIQHHTGASSPDEARERAAALSLAGVAERIAQPCLVITGRHDRLIPWADTKRIADEAPNGEWVLFDDGNHVCNNIPYKYRPLVGDWMAYRLRA